MLALFLLPLLTLAGANTVISLQNNTLLLLALFLNGVLVLIICLPINLVSQRLYPIAIWVISFCLLFQILGTSPYLMGTDVNLEYFLFEGVKSSGHWYSGSAELYNGLLSVTVLPTIIQSVLAVDDTTVFKVAYPIVFSFAPVILYLAYRHVIGAKGAFLSAVLFMSYISYYQEVNFIERQMIAEVILASLILVTLSSSLRSKTIATLPIILIIGLVASHYSTMYVYVFISLVSWIVLRILKRRTVNTLPIIGLALVVAVGWYTYTASGVAFTRLLDVVAIVSQTFSSQFFSPQSRGTLVVKALGIGVNPTLMNRMFLYTDYLIQALIVVGAIKLWTERKNRAIRGELLGYTCAGLCFLGLGILVPSLAAGLGSTRVYQLSLVFISPACVIGGEAIFTRLFRLFSTRHRSVSQPRLNINLTLVSCIIVLFLLFNTGFMHQVSGDKPISPSLGYNQLRASNVTGLVTYFHSDYIQAQDVASSRWLSTYAADNLKTCGDIFSRWTVMNSYGGIPQSQQPNTPLLYPGAYGPGCEYFYLSYMNVVNGIGVGPTGWLGQTWSTLEVSDLLVSRNTVYSNGGSNILA